MFSFTLSMPPRRHYVPPLGWLFFFLLLIFSKHQSLLLCWPLFLRWVRPLLNRDPCCVLTHFTPPPFTSITPPLVTSATASAWKKNQTYSLQLCPKHSFPCSIAIPPFLLPRKSIIPFVHLRLCITSSHILLQLPQDNPDLTSSLKMGTCSLLGQSVQQTQIKAVIVQNQILQGIWSQLLLVK